MSTRSLVTVAGGLIGAYFGYPQLGLVLGGLIGSAVDPATVQGPAINEVAVQTQAEGVPRIIPYGTVMCIGNVIQNGPLIKTTESSTQGKGGTSVETPTAYRTFAIGICEGPIAGMLRVWEDNKLVYDMRPGSLMVAESTKWMSNKFLRTGGEDQEPDPFLAFIDPETPAYRGTALLTFVLEDQTDRGGSFKQYRFEVAKALSSLPLTVVPASGSGRLGTGNGAINGPTTPGQGGGATLATGVSQSVSCALGSPTQLQNGAAYLAQWRFQARGVGMNLTAWLKIGGVQVWSTPVLLTDGQFVLHRVQINHAADGVTMVEIGFTANGASNSQGYFSFGVDQLSVSGYAAYAVSGTPPLYYESANVLFGVLTDGSTLYSAGAVPSGLGYTTDWGPATFAQNVGAPTTLGAIVGDIHQRCGVAASLYDVLELTDQVAGFSIAGAYTGADAINALRAIYMFDKSDHDGKLWYPKRGKAVAKTLTIADLTEVPDTTQREQAGEIPYKINLKYQHAASGYAQPKATAPNTPSPDRRTTGEVTMATAVVLDENQAAQAVDKIYKITLAEANGTTELSVPIAVAADLADADCVGLYLRGRTSRLRIEQSAFSDWTVKFTLRADRQSAYTSAVTGIPIPLPTLPPSTIVGATQLAVMDIPARTDSEDDLSVMVGVSSANAAWYGAQLQRSTDGGASYSNLLQIDSATVMGTLLADVPAASTHYTDRTNSVKVKLTRAGQTLDTLTDAQFLSGQGGFALQKADGTWEVMQYRDAHLELDGSFTLTMLHRGRLHSVGAAHTTGATFVLLATATHTTVPASALGIGLTHQAVSLGDSADNTTNDTTITYAGKSQTEWPVASFVLSRSGNIVTASWAPRHRFGSDDWPVASVNFQGFRVTIVGTSTVTFDQAASTFTYDVSAIGGSVTVSVSAINRITGAGPSTSGTI
ncbi:phage tail baseplate protein [Variovorax sp. GT1P44]|uniref:GTA baseplate fiber-binding domain-containing protein n=1 Tax=Variovorax sp. GT1P44 TaxID=3443742 RepID=UPI003F467BD3